VSLFVSCPGELSFNDIGGRVATCSTDWTLHTASEIIDLGINSSLPTPESLILAFGAGVAVMVPLYAALWGIRAARESINKS
jgi:hypothetical protein